MPKGYEYASITEAKNNLNNGEVKLILIMNSIDNPLEAADNLLKMLGKGLTNAKENPRSSLADAERIIESCGPLLTELKEESWSDSTGKSAYYMQRILLGLKWMVTQYANVTKDWDGASSFTREKLYPLAPTKEIRMMLGDDKSISEKNNMVGPSHKTTSNGCLIAMICGGATMYGLFELIKMSLRLFA